MPGSSGASLRSKRNFVRLSDVVESMKNGIYKPSSDYADDGVACLRMYNIAEGQIDWRNIKRIRLSERDLSDYELRAGDLLLNRVNSRELVGKTALIPNGLEQCIYESKNIRLRILKNLALPAYVSYALLAFGREYFDKNAQQVVGMASVNQTQVGNFEFWLPPLPTQHRIVQALEEKLSRLDAAQSALLRAQANLKRYRASVLEEACTQTIALAPLKPFGNFLAHIESGKSFKCEERPPRPGEVGVAKVSAVTWGEYDEQQTKTCKDESRIEERYLIKPDDFLFTRANTIELIGACVIAQQVSLDVMLSDKILRFHFTGEIDMRWALVWLKSPFGRKEIERLSTGNQESMRNIGQERIRQIQIAVPPLETQQKIVAEVERHLSLITRTEQSLQTQLARAKRLRQSILQQAFAPETCLSSNP